MKVSIMGTLKMLLLVVAYILPLFLSQAKMLPSEGSQESNEGQVHSPVHPLCNNQKVKEEVAKYGPVVNQIFDTVLQGAWKNHTWSTLSDFVDKFGSRMSGSDSLERSIDYMVDTMKDHDIENVHTEPAMVKSWKRGREFCKLLSPREHTMTVLGLGGSVSTPDGGITAPVMVVASFDELKARKDEVPGKIVVFNPEWVSYDETVQYRTSAAKETASLGGLASLVRSITPFSLDTPHTGWQSYEEGITKIPTACITVEDAAILHRMARRGDELVIHLEMESTYEGMTESRNTIGELTGTTRPDDVVLVSGHMDTWDVGDGAMDDGGGVFISWNALAVLKMMGIRAKRTIRAVLWTGEEQGWLGAQAYYEQHQHELDRFKLVMESDSGTFNPRGIEFGGKPEATCVVKEVMKLMEPLDATQLIENPQPGPDITFFTREGVPGMGLLNDNDNYFWYHHSPADTMLAEDSGALDRCLALWTATAYVIADLEEDLPK